MTEFQMRVSSLASCTLVTVWGGLDAGNGAEFQKRLLAVVDEAKHAVIVDLQWLEFLDASVVNTLLLARGYGRDRQVRVELAGARGRVAALLCILGLEEALSLRADVYEAVCILQDHDLPQSASARRTSPTWSRPGTR